MAEPKSTASPVARLLLLGAGHFAMDGYGQSVAALLPTFAALYAAGQLKVSMLWIVLQVSSSASQPVWGILGDRAGLRFGVTFGPLVAAGAFAAIALRPPFAVLALLVAATGVGVASFHPHAAVEVQRAAGSGSERAMSVFLFAGTLGLGIMPVAVFALTRFWGVTGLVAALPPGAVLTALFLRLGLAPRHAPARRVRAVSEEPRRPRRSGIVVLVTTSVMRAFVIVSAYAVIPFILPEDSGGGWSVPIYVGSLAFSAGLGGLVYGLIAPPFRAKWAIAVSCLAAAPILVLFTFTADGWAGLALLVAFGLVLGSTVPMTVSMSQRMIPRSAGLASGLTMGFSWGIGGALGTFLLAGAAQRLEPAFGLRTANLLALGLAAVVLVAAGGIACFLPSREPCSGREVGDVGQIERA